jgi:hypothetical protein
VDPSVGATVAVAPTVPRQATYLYTRRIRPSARLATNLQRARASRQHCHTKWHNVLFSV